MQITEKTQITNQETSIELFSKTSMCAEFLMMETYFSFLKKIPQYMRGMQTSSHLDLKWFSCH